MSKCLHRRIYSWIANDFLGKDLYCGCLDCRKFWVKNMLKKKRRKK